MQAQIMKIVFIVLFTSLLQTFSAARIHSVLFEDEDEYDQDINDEYDSYIEDKNDDEDEDIKGEDEIIEDEDEAIDDQYEDKYDQGIDYHETEVSEESEENEQKSNTITPVDEVPTYEEQLEKLRKLELEIQEQRKQLKWLRAEAVKKPKKRTDSQAFKNAIQKNFKIKRKNIDEKDNTPLLKSNAVLSVEEKLNKNVDLMKENMPKYFETLEKGREVAERMRKMEKEYQNQDEGTTGNEKESNDYETILDQDLATSNKTETEAQPNGYIDKPNLVPELVKEIAPSRQETTDNEASSNDYIAISLSLQDPTDSANDGMVAPTAVKESTRVINKTVKVGAAKNKKGRKETFKVEEFHSENISDKDDTGQDKETVMMEKMLEMMKEMKSEDGDENDNEPLSIEEQKKRIKSQSDGHIFSVKFSPKNKTKAFSLPNGKIEIHEGNSRFGTLIETDNMEKSKRNIFIPKSILDPEKINNSLTLILTFVKRKNPLTKIKPQFKKLFENKYVFWKIPEEFRNKEGSVELQISGEHKQSWKKVQEIDTDNIFRNLVEFDVTEVLKKINSTANGRIIMKTKEQLYESDPIKLGEDKSTPKDKGKKERNYTFDEI